MSKTSCIVWKAKRRKEIHSRVTATIIYSVMFLIGVFGFIHGFETVVGAEERTPLSMMDGEIYEVECTAYCNQNGNLTASGHKTVEGVTVAGAKEWLGCTCIMYDEDMNFIGFFDFTDTGYGRNGDIPRGETIDRFYESKQDALAWGRRKVYIQIVPAVG